MVSWTFWWYFESISDDEAFRDSLRGVCRLEGERGCPGACQLREGGGDKGGGGQSAPFRPKDNSHRMIDSSGLCGSVASLGPLEALKGARGGVRGQRGALWRGNRPRQVPLWWTGVALGLYLWHREDCKWQIKGISHFSRLRLDAVCWIYTYIYITLWEEPSFSSKAGAF